MAEVLHNLTCEAIYIYYLIGAILCVGTLYHYEIYFVDSVILTKIAKLLSLMCEIKINKTCTYVFQFAVDAT